MRPIPEPQSFAFIECAELHVVSQAVAFHEVYRYVDIWNTFEAACRFHRLAHRVFNNLRYYARIKRRLKRCVAKKRLATKKLFFSLIKGNAKMMLRRNSTAATNQSLAEQLQNAVRTHTIGL